MSDLGMEQIVEGFASSTKEVHSRHLLTDDQRKVIDLVACGGVLDTEGAAASDDSAQENGAASPEPFTDAWYDDGITKTRKMAELFKSFERGRHTRELHTVQVSGRLLHAVVKFSRLTRNDDTGVCLSNRLHLYRYLQDRGVAFIDHTTLAAGSRGEMWVSLGSLLLPEEINRADYYALEDEVRKAYPFDDHELSVLRIIDEKAGKPKSPAEAFGVDMNRMRELVDMLSMDERFSSLFEIADKLRSARRSRPTVDNSGLST